mmetsp:Transcript_2824/g.10234  ORF Transcript_2824/g.10234 Transcript_2824/m.10234 type:complete len:246 (-) Transcript_2824:3177-3914(-)
MPPRRKGGVTSAVAVVSTSTAEKSRPVAASEATTNTTYVVSDSRPSSTISTDPPGCRTESDAALERTAAFGFASSPVIICGVTESPAKLLESKMATNAREGVAVATSMVMDTPVALERRGKPSSKMGGTGSTPGGGLGGGGACIGGGGEGDGSGGGGGGASGDSAMRMVTIDWSRPAWLEATIATSTCCEKTTAKGSEDTGSFATMSSIPLTSTSSGSVASPVAIERTPLGPSASRSTVPSWKAM